MQPTLWMVRAGESAYLIDEFISNSIVAIGWNELGDLSDVTQLKTIKEKFREKFPEDKKSKLNLNAGQVYRFIVEFKRGDKVITYNPGTRNYHLGEIIGIYRYSKSECDYNHIREVKWQREISRDDLSTETKNMLGAIMTIFKITDEPKKELLGLTSKSQKEEKKLPEEEFTLDTIKDEIELKAIEFIKDKLNQLDWENMEELAAGLLRGMGYKTIISPAGPDRGKDVMASPDGLGLENPKIKVEVKHRKGVMGAPDIRNFLGGLRSTDRGLYVSTGGFTKEARYEAERANIPITLIDSELLVRLVIQHYDHFDADTQTILPLKKIYWPV